MSETERKGKIHREIEIEKRDSEIERGGGVGKERGESEMNRPGCACFH